DHAIRRNDELVAGARVVRDDLGTGHRLDLREGLEEVARLARGDEVAPIDEARRQVEAVRLDRLTVAARALTAGHSADRPSEHARDEHEPDDDDPAAATERETRSRALAHRADPCRSGAGAMTMSATGRRETSSARSTTIAPISSGRYAMLARNTARAL